MKKIKLGLSFERQFLCPAGTGPFHLLSLGRLRGVRQGGAGYGAAPPCIPPEAPRLGFPISVIPRGLRGPCCGSFLALLGDLPARRAMPACGFILNERLERASHWLWKGSGMAAGCWGKVICNEVFEFWGWALRCVGNALLLGLRRGAGGNEAGLSFERRVLCPTGTGAFSFL